MWLCVCVCARASSHYLLLPAPGDSAPTLHLSSWLATICLSTSSSLVSRSNWSSCTQTQWKISQGESFMYRYDKSEAYVRKAGWQFDSRECCTSTVYLKVVKNKDETAAAMTTFHNCTIPVLYITVLCFGIQQALNAQICFSNWTAWIALHCLTDTSNNAPSIDAPPCVVLTLGKCLSGSSLQNCK